MKRKAPMESISSNLHDFLKKTGNNLSVPDKKFLRDGLDDDMIALDPDVIVKPLVVHRWRVVNHVLHGVEAAGFLAVAVG